jgi:hypothetical protein
MGSGFGLDGGRSARGNRSLRKKRTPFAGRGEVADHRVMQFAPKTRLNPQQLKKLGIATRKAERDRRLKALAATLALVTLLLVFAYLYLR